MLSAQEDFLAKQYFQDGDYEKALVFYEKLVETNPRRTDYAEGLVACYQQLERYDEAEAFLLQKIEDSYAFPTFFIELGYNHTLKNEPEKANAYYDKAIQKIEDNPSDIVKFNISFFYSTSKHNQVEKIIFYFFHFK